MTRSGHVASMRKMKSPAPPRHWSAVAVLLRLDVLWWRSILSSAAPFFPIWRYFPLQPRPYNQRCPPSPLVKTIEVLVNLKKEHLLDRYKRQLFLISSEVTPKLHQTQSIPNRDAFLNAIYGYIDIERLILFVNWLKWKGKKKRFWFIGRGIQIKPVESMMFFIEDKRIWLRFSFKEEQGNTTKTSPSEDVRSATEENFG